MDRNGIKILKQIRHSQKIEQSVYQLKPDQVKQLLADLTLVGIAYEAGGDYRATARRLGRKYLGRRKKLYDVLANHNNLSGLTGTLVADVNFTSDQSVQPTQLVELQEQGALDEVA
jgi:hypothetical protein